MATQYRLTVRLENADVGEKPDAVLQAIKKLGEVTVFEPRPILNNERSFDATINVPPGKHAEVLDRCAATEKPLKLIHKFPWCWYSRVVKDEPEVLVDDGVEAAEDDGLVGTQHGE